MMNVQLRVWLLGASVALSGLASAVDWPQWRSDASRSAASPQNVVVEELRLQWVRKLPPLEPAFRDVRLQFDRGYEPVVAGKRMFFGSSRDDSMVALDTDTGAMLWRYVSDGPIRFAPVAWGGSVYFGSDDGHFYCLNEVDGSLRWKYKAVPSDRLLLGNRRVISTWPVRGGPVLRDEKIYFAAGVWSFEGVFVYALDAKTGELVWLNDQCGYIYGAHPHNAVAFGGLAPQGYLLINGDELVVPSSSAYPARFDLKTGALIDFQLPAAGRKPGGWFVATGDDGGGMAKLGLMTAAELAHKRALLYERSVNQKRHEGELKVEGKDGVRTAIWASGQRIDFAKPPPGVEGTVHAMLAADEKLFVVTEEGEIRCFGKTEPDAVVAHDPKLRVANSSDEGAEALLSQSGAKQGIAVLLGMPDVSFVETLVMESHLQAVVVESSPERVASSRAALVESGLYGHRVSIRLGDPMRFELPPYLADLIVSSLPVPGDALERIANSVRPFGGKLSGPRSKTFEDAELPGFRVETSGDRVTLTRESLPGSTNYTGDWSANADALVRAPVGVLWFDDTLGHFKRSPQPRIVDGVMVSADKNWLDASTRTEKTDYRLKPAVFSDVYTGRILSDDEVPMLSASVTEFDLESVQPSQYRPPKQKDHWKPGQPEPGVRKNPLTGEEEPRKFPKSYGCDGGFDYGNLYTLRSGTAAFYDKRLESGTINLSGPRSGCTNSIIPANGVLNVPYFFEGCTCSYPLPTALALVSMPKTHEQWASWGDVPSGALEGKIHRIGINFGAPGDRMTDEGTLWLDHPNTGGPSPQVRVDVEPSEGVRNVYRHSLWIENGSEEVWPWVTASTVVGARDIRVHGLKNGTYRARLFFAELEGAERSFGVSVQGETVESNLTPSARAGGDLRGVVLEVPAVQIEGGVAHIQLSAKTGETSLSGIELVRD